MKILGVLNLHKPGFSVELQEPDTVVFLRSHSCAQNPFVLLARQVNNPPIPNIGRRKKIMNLRVLRADDRKGTAHGACQGKK